MLAGSSICTFVFQQDLCRRALRRSAKVATPVDAQTAVSRNASGSDDDVNAALEHVLLLIVSQVCLRCAVARLHSVDSLFLFLLRRCGICTISRRS